MISPQVRRVVCTGIGTVNPLGLNAKESWNALLNSKSGIRKLKKKHSFEGCQSRIAAYIDEDKLVEHLGQPGQSYLVRNSKQLSRATLYAMLASHEALEDANVLDEPTGHLREEYRENCGVAIGQGMVDFEDIYENSKLVMEVGGFRRMSPYFMTRALMNMSAGNVSIRYKIHGPNHCVSTACATGAHSIGDAFQLIRSNKADLMVCGSTEASINSTAMAGFERLRALCIKFNENPEKASRPFDSRRAGFVMGEGAGILVLEELEHAKKRGLKSEQIYGEILGYGMGSDAYHLTAPQPDGGGAKRCMEAALTDARLSGSEIGHVNAHATSTPLGDDIECNAIEDLLYAADQRGPTVTSCKGALGHLLGGAGSVESIMALLSCKSGIQPHCSNLEDPLASSGGLVRFVRGSPVAWTAARRVLMKNSFGFGGTNASIIMCNFL